MQELTFINFDTTDLNIKEILKQRSTGKENPKMNFLINYKEQSSSNENFILIKQIDTMQQTIINDNGTDYNIKK